VLDGSRPHTRDLFWHTLSRQEVAQTIERLIAILDQIDGEADLEAGVDEEARFHDGTVVE
jgi:hypothetical protein